MTSRVVARSGQELYAQFDSSVDLEFKPTVPSKPHAKKQVRAHDFSYVRAQPPTGNYILLTCVMDETARFPMYICRCF